MRSWLLPDSVLFEMRWLGGLITPPLDASLPQSADDESPWQSHSVIGAWWWKRDEGREREKCPVASFIEWRCNGAYTPSRDWVRSINNKQESKSSHLFTSYCITAHNINTSSIQLMLSSTSASFNWELKCQGMENQCAGVLVVSTYSMFTFSIWPYLKLWKLDIVFGDFSTRNVIWDVYWLPTSSYLLKKRKQLSVSLWIGLTELVIMNMKTHDCEHHEFNFTFYSCEIFFFILMVQIKSFEALMLMFYILYRVFCSSYPISDSGNIVLLVFS